MLLCGMVRRIEFLENLSVKTDGQKKEYAVGDKLTVEVIGEYNEMLDLLLSDGSVIYNVPRWTIKPFSLG